MVAPVPRGEDPAALFATASQLDIGASGVRDLLGAILANLPDWHADALCQEYPDVNFFPCLGDDVRPAGRICARTSAAPGRSSKVPGSRLGEDVPSSVELRW